MNYERNPDVRCARRRPPCEHQRREHAKDKCFGITIVHGVTSDCRCPGFFEPGESEPRGRQQETA